MKSELISIIVPVFNGEKVIARCIESLLQQTYQYIEIIIIDDGSSDKTEEICRRYCTQNHNIRYHLQKNQGPGAARNKGLMEATGDFVAFIDADDYVYPCYLTVLYQNIIKFNADISACSYYKIWDEEEIPELQGGQVCKLLNSEEALKSLFYRKEMMGYPFLKLIKKELIKDKEFRINLLLGEDYFFVFELLKECRRIVYTNCRMYIYYQNMNGLTSTLSMQTLQSFWSIAEELFWDGSDYLKNAVIAKMYITAIDFYIQLTDEEKGSEFGKKLYGFIGANSYKVFEDRECKVTDRVIGFMGIVSIHLMLWLCGVGKKLNRQSKLRLRQAV